MKKTIFTLAISISTICGFSQTIQVSKDGKSAVISEPAIASKETVVTKETILSTKKALEIKIENLKVQIAEAELKLQQVQTVCDKLGYK